jgi:hypothetical protein
VLVRCDGTNVFDQFNHVVNNMSFGGNISVAGNASVTGTTTLLDDLILGGSPGTSGQVVVSQGAGNPPAWGNAFVAGMIMMWSGTIATIPSGWLLCNGSSGTPDLRNRFIIGANADDAGVAKTNITGSPTQTGGSKDSTLVSHTHSESNPGNFITGSVNIDTGGSSGIFSSGSGAFSVSSGNNRFVSGGNTSAGTRHMAFNIDAGSHTHTISTEGSSGTNANLVPYYALAFIMKA